jgi:hypothetical protein
LQSLKLYKEELNNKEIKSVIINRNLILELKYDITLSENSFNNKKDVEYNSMLYKDELFLLKDKKILIVIIISEILNGLSIIKILTFMILFIVFSYFLYTI